MRGVGWVVPKENGGYSFMVMRKRLDCERRGGEGITAGRGEMGMGEFWEGDCGCMGSGVVGLSSGDGMEM